MNILVIGNGFDLAHGLPTRYTDFLEFVKEFIHFNTEIFPNLLFWSFYGEENKMQEFIKKWHRNPYYEEFKKNIESNIWIDYFIGKKDKIKENWIDFEKEIFQVIKSIETDMQGKDFDSLVEQLSNWYLDNMLHGENDFISVNEKEKRGGKQDITFRELKNKLYGDLNRFNRALEIYLCEYVEKKEVNEKIPDIDELEIDYVLSFNYTHTFAKLYKISKKIEKEEAEAFDYIHGEANIENTVESNNMVLGIHESLPDDRRDQDVEFIDFKKFYQRVYKGTGCKYKEWVDKIQWGKRKVEERLGSFESIPFENYQGNGHYLYIFGHSLDVTDKDILRELILNENVYTTIYYRNLEQRGQQIANLVKVIGSDELVKRTGGNTKTIEFKLQRSI